MDRQPFIYIYSFDKNKKKLFENLIFSSLLVISEHRNKETKTKIKCENGPSEEESLVCGPKRSAVSVAKTVRIKQKQKQKTIPQKHQHPLDLIAIISLEAIHNKAETQTPPPPPPPPPSMAASFTSIVESVPPPFHFLQLRILLTLLFPLAGDRAPDGRHRRVEKLRSPFSSEPFARFPGPP